MDDGAFLAACHDLWCDIHRLGAVARENDYAGTRAGIFCKLALALDASDLFMATMIRTKDYEHTWAQANAERPLPQDPARS